MIARFNNLGRVREVPTAGEVAGVSIGTIALILIPMLVVTFIAPYARAQDQQRWPASDLSTWYRSLMQPDNPSVSCCGKADAYWADIVETGPSGELIAVITDERPDGPLGCRHIPPGTRFVVPPYKIKFDKGNPTGHIVIFINTADQVLCYVQNGGV